MSQVRFIGCLHLGHKWMAAYRGFQDEFYHDEHLIENWNKIVSPKDLTYVLGDVTMNSTRDYYSLDRLHGRKIVVLGNHDNPKHVRELLNYVDHVAGMIDYKYNHRKYILTHAPIHPNETSFCDANIHAHIHHKNILTECLVPNAYGDFDKTPNPTVHKYKCVDAKLINFQPKTIEELMI